jgi:hypothetical protein
MMNQHVIIGAGEVGEALAAVLGDAHLRDIEPTGPDTADVLHICFPCGIGFVDHVRDYERAYGARLVIVHSTVPVGTCDPNGWVHSPVRGRHPNLVESLRLFVKFFGGARADQAAQQFKELGVPVQATELAATTEAGKLWELTQYGVQVAVEKAIHAYCSRAGLDFGLVYAGFARTYNRGYAYLGLEHLTRPVLEHMSGPVGGHCVLMGSELLDHELGDLVLRASARAEQEEH